MQLNRQIEMNILRDVEYVKLHHITAVWQYGGIWLNLKMVLYLKDLANPKDYACLVRHIAKRQDVRRNST
jgi:hypothetical protein